MYSEFSVFKENNGELFKRGSSLTDTVTSIRMNRMFHGIKKSLPLFADRQAPTSF